MKEINGNAPYLTFDNGETKVTTTESLLWITLSDGTHITPAINTSATTPIVLPNAGETLADVQMLVPTTTNTIALNALIGAPYNYWGDDDGDGQGINGITVTGDLSLSITDKYNKAVSRSTSLDICNAPYKVQLTSSPSSLTTQYGVPDSSSISGSTAIYYINPKVAPKICYARPNLLFGKKSVGWSGHFAGPATIWNPDKGFLVQSTASSGYNRNFPTTGGNNLYFDLDIGGIKGSNLTWTTISQGGITATMTPSPDNLNDIRVTLTGPAATSSQISSSSPGSIGAPTLPQAFELVGYDSSHREVLKYGFVLKQWFVARPATWGDFYEFSSWCASLGDGYRLPQVKDATNAVCATNQWWCQGAVGATPSSSDDYYQRNIGASFSAEWGDPIGGRFPSNYSWTSDKVSGSVYFTVAIGTGQIDQNDINYRREGYCVYP